MNKRYYEHTLPIIRGSLSNTYVAIWQATTLKLYNGKKIPIKKPGTYLYRADGTPVSQAVFPKGEI
ncbi:MAG: hypothetical protein SOW54_15165 [Bacteroides sp.]|uniref:hypothetical protein n=1 Tax=Bacteroides sp. TaxID=29523 RepID=UPI002A74F70C|nr:hypothetical protein [Bacteroides sp.]MDY3140083.1 hypothetical protein [Bacteroides sp.]